jgi:hypothetical protein
MALRASRSATLGARLFALLAVAAVVTIATPASAADGASTPGVTVTATNPEGSKAGSDLALTLTAHTEPSTTTNPSCRPQDKTLVCSGSLVLRIPEFGDLGVGEFVVHRLAVGDITCGDEGGEGDGCGDHAMGVTAPVVPEPILVQVNGVGVVKWPGNTGLAVGTKLQLKFTLSDNGRAKYQDTVVVEVRLFVEGPDKPLLYKSVQETIQQVQIHFVDDGN